MSPVGKDNGSCGNINLPCKTLNHAAEVLAKKNDVIKIDSQSGDILISRPISFDGETLDMKLTSYNGRPTIKSLSNDKLNLFDVIDAINATVNMNLTFLGLRFHNIQLIRIKKESFDTQEDEVVIQIYDCIFNYDATLSYQLLDISTTERTRFYIEIGNCSVKGISKLKIFKVSARAPNFFFMRVVNSLFHNISNLLAYHLLEAHNQHVTHIINSSFISEGKQIENTALISLMYAANGTKTLEDNSSFQLNIATCIFVNGSSVLQLKYLHLPLTGEMTLSVNNSTFVGNGIRMTNDDIESDRMANDNSALFIMKSFYLINITIVDCAFEKNIAVLEMNGNMIKLKVKNSKFAGNGIRMMIDVNGSSGTVNHNQALLIVRGGGSLRSRSNAIIDDCIFEKNIPVLKLVAFAELSVKNSKFVGNGIQIMNGAISYHATENGNQALLKFNPYLIGFVVIFNVAIADCVFEKNIPVLAMTAEWIKLTIKNSKFVGNGIRKRNGVIGSDRTVKDNPALLMIKSSGLHCGLYNAIIADCVFEKNIPVIAMTGDVVNLTVKNSKFVGNGIQTMKNGIEYDGTVNNYKALLIFQSDLHSHWRSNVTIANCVYERNIPVLKLDANVKLSVKNSQFVGNGIRMTAILTICGIKRKCAVTIADCIFLNNSSILSAIGVTKMSVVNSKFIGNHGIRGTALTIDKVEKIKIVNCAFKENQAVSKSMCGERELSGNGGALLIVGENLIVIEDSRFENNTASCLGDSVYIESQGEITLKNVSFKSSIISSTSSGTMWYSISKSLSFHNVSLRENDTSRRSRTIYTANAKRFIVGKIPVNYQCPMGANVNLYSKTKDQTVARVECKFCLDKTYTLEESFANVRNFSASNRGIHTAKCQPCPFGATCISKIRPKMNFWGYIQKNKAHLISCPPGYCCQTAEECISLESCNAKRRGVLCGQCSEGYAQSVFSGKCIQNSQCNSWQFWGILIAICFGLVLAIAYLQDILAVIFRRLNLRAILRSFPRRSNFTNSQMLTATDGYQEEQDTSIEEKPNFERTISESSSLVPTILRTETQKKQENTSTTSGLIKILFFYYQMNALLVIYKSEYQLFIFNQMKSFFNNLFTFNASSETLSNLGCPFPGMDIVRKRLIKASMPCMMLGLASGTLLIVVISAKFIKSAVVSNYIASLKNRLLVTILQIILLGYSSLTSNIFSLLTCISMVNGTKILFIQGNINCYQTWQFILLSFVIFWSLPLTIALYMASIRVKEKTLTIEGFFCALMFPLPSVIYFTFKRALSQDETSELIESPSLDDVNHQVSPTTNALGPLLQTTDQPQPQLPHQQQQPALRAKLLYVLASSFRRADKDGGRLQWEPVLIAQRLVLLTLHAFLTNPVIKTLSMLATVILITCINIAARPFHSMFLNGLNTMYLLFLCMSGINNSLYAYIYIGETKPSGPILDTLRVLDIIELAMHLLFPCVAVAAAIMIIITKLFHLLYSLLVYTMRWCKTCITQF